VRALSGRGGGYTLTRSADSIRVGEIIEAAIGPIAITECAAEPETCPYADFCNCQGLYALLNHRIAEVLNRHTLADLLDQNWRSRVNKELEATR
jgi:Rrf2 family protein